MNSNNFMQVEKDSHHWTSLEMLINNLMHSQMGVDYLIKGLENTRKYGYDITQVSKPMPGPESNPLIIDLQETFLKCIEMVRIKNNDYSGEKAIDPYANFKKSEAIGVKTEKGILVRMMDKMSRISNLVEQDAQVKSEKIEDTLDDLINYAAILKSYLKSNKK